MKKFLFIMAGLFLSLNLANANDLLFKASNGVLSENSHGVKKLSDEELRQVRGGLKLEPLYMANGRYGNEFLAADNLTGQVMYYSISYWITLDATEAGHQAIYNYDMLGTPKTRYMHFNSLAAASKSEATVLTVVYNYSARVISFSVNVLNKNTGVSRRVDSHTENAILGSELRMQALNAMYGDLRRYAK